MGKRYGNRTDNHTVNTHMNKALWDNSILSDDQMTVAL